MRRLVRAREGFGLVESLVSMGIAATGLIAVAGLMAVSANQMATTRDGGRASALAVSRLERLRVLPHNHAQRQLGGSLTANVATHSEILLDPQARQFTVRWQVTNGPAGTREIAVRVIPANPQSPAADVRGLLWR